MLTKTINCFIISNDMRKIVSTNDKKFLGPERELQMLLKIRMIMAGVSVTEVARALGLSKPYVSNVIAGRRRNEKVIEYILNLPVKKGA